MAEVQIRASRGLGAFALAIGLLGAVLIAIGFVRAPVFVLAVAALFFSGLGLVLDRRVKLAISEEGVRYARWGPSVVPWHEFSGFRRTVWRQQPHLQLVPRRPSELVASFSAYGKLNHSSYRVAGMPPFSIAVTQLDVHDGDLAALVARYLPEEPSA